MNAHEVLRVFKQSKKPLNRIEIIRALKAPKKAMSRLNQVLQDLSQQGKIMHLSKGAYGLVGQLHLVPGVLEMQRSGMGFVICDDKRRRDIYISPDNLGDAWHGDYVAVAATSAHGRRPEGRIARVIERRTSHLAVRVQRRMDSYLLCHPDNPKIIASLMVDGREFESMPIPGDVLWVRVGELLEPGIWEGFPEEFIGEEDDPAVQEKLVKMNHDIPTIFPDEVLDEADALPTAPAESDFKGREDLRDLGFVTIDGATARDFDDAIYVEKLAHGYTLWVAIADVSHYVPTQSYLDREARARGNSYYFPQSVEPMFPERLSNGLCSLNPHTPRLVMVAEMQFTRDGVPRRENDTFYPAVIYSHARLTYGQVNRAVLLKEPEEREKIKERLPMLETAEKLARQINARRLERGSIDFELPDPTVIFDEQGRIQDIRARGRHFGHQIIEEFMIAANESVAEFLRDRELPCMYRVHPEPDMDKLSGLFKLLSRTDLAESLPHVGRQGPTPLELQQLLDIARGTELEFLVGRLTLRAMMQAKYAPENIGHFGLASGCYCHFTSPIRRYADLVVHRSLKNALAVAQGAGPLEPTQRMKKLKRLGVKISELERKAMEAEREIYKRLSALFLRDRVGDEFDGVVNSVSDYGFWVELTGVLAEGMVRLSNMSDDYYVLLPERQELIGERSGRRIKLGQPVRVALTDVNVARMEINLELVF